MNQDRLFTEMYILHCIGELDEKSSERFMKHFANFPYETIEDAIRDFEQSESVSVALVEWVKTSWIESEGLTPKQFAKNIYQDFRSSVE